MLLHYHQHEMPLRKASRAYELRRIRALYSRYEGRLSKSFLRMVSSLQSPEILNEIRRYLEVGNLVAARSTIRDQVVDFTDDLTNTFADAGAAEASIVASRLGGGRASAISFKPGNPEAARLMGRQSLRFIQNFTRMQRQSTKQALVRALRLGMGARATAKAIRDSIGLTPSQEQIVANYRGSLERNSSDALNRALRDRRFDQTVESAIEDDMPLGSSTIDRMVARYRANYVNFRAETISRTETLQAVNGARHTSMNQAIDDAGFDSDKVTRMWNTAGDARVRDTHDELEGTEVEGTDEPFESSSGALLLYPGDPEAPPDEICNCRCVVTYELPSGEEIDQESDE